ncbi:MAG: hypothetical protein IPK35_15620 [Saprospiraceae bacterium]|jgi:hypothetical protein|nr:hypothetical protein [Saprospiraceae bacterium]
MKPKILNALLIVTSLFGYLEWSGDSHTFLFQAEAEILYKLFTNPTSVVHPFILLPLAGQVLLFITLFQKSPSKILTYVSVAGLGLLLGFMFIIGIISQNYKILISTLPFLVVAVLTIINLRKTKSI